MGLQQQDAISGDFQREGGEGDVGLWGDGGNEGKVDHAVPEGTAPTVGGQGRGGEHGGSISLEVTEMVADDLLDVDAGGMV
eukprot:g22501.t1